MSVPPADDPLVHQAKSEPVSIRKVVAASLIGTSLEWYDFFIYGIAAALVLNRVFFPNFDPLVGTMLSFTAFAVGFVARPLGGVIFGHYGDQIGRKNVLVATLVLMGAATALVGLLPTYSQIGALAPALLILLRILQGFSAGGEWGGAALLSVENAPINRPQPARMPTSSTKVRPFSSRNLLMVVSVHRVSFENS